MKPITTSDAARILGVSPMRIRQIAQTGAIGEKLGVQWIFTENEVERYKPRHKTKRGPEKKSGKVA